MEFLANRSSVSPSPIDALLDQAVLRVLKDFATQHRLHPLPWEVDGTCDVFNISAAMTGDDATSLDVSSWIQQLDMTRYDTADERMEQWYCEHTKWFLCVTINNAPVN